MSTGPLSGVKVLEIAGIGPGPFCGMLLADLGADVVRVDRPGGGGMQLVPWADDLLNRGKRSIAVDLAKPGGAETVLSLVEHADILFEGFRPGVAERLGIGPEPCLLRRPQLIYGRMTGWGQDGPIAHTAGHDITYIAPTGALHAIGQAGGPPQIPLNLVGDFAGGSMYLLVGMLAALDEARRSGRGQVVDAAIVDGTAHLMTMIYSCYAGGVWSDERGTNLGDGGSPFYGVYQTSDAKFMAVGALEPQFYAEFLRLLELTVGPQCAIRPRRVAAAASYDRRRLRRPPPAGMGKDIQRQRRLRGTRTRHVRCAGPSAIGRPQYLFRRQWHNPAVPGPPFLAHSGSRRQPTLRTRPAHRRGAR